MGPCVHGRAHVPVIKVLDCHQDIRIVMARCCKSTIGMSEHPPETRPGSHWWCESRSVVDHTVLGEQFDDLFVEPVIDAVRIAVDEIDNLVLVYQPPKCGFGVTVTVATAS